MIHKSLIDQNSYKYDTLSNGIKVLTISNINADKAACAMSISVGSFQDPADTPGLAHFLEHMLFMGTSDYPDENEFDRFLSEHNGYSNAYTDNEITAYYFEVDTKYLRGAVDRFSGFFRCPLMLEDSVQREILAVDSEFKNGLDQDEGRIHRMIGYCTQEQYLFSKFSVGNKKTLDKKGIRDELISFYNKYYSPEKMCLVILGKETNDELFNMVTEFFEPIKSNLSDNITDSNTLRIEQIFKKEFIGNIIKIRPIGEISRLVITVSLPSEYLLYEINLYKFMSYVLDRENEGSLLHKLKSEGYAYQLTLEYESTKSHSLVSLSFDLTEEGSNNHLIILEIIESYLKNALHENHFSLQEYMDLRSKSYLEFSYKENENANSFCVNLCHAMQYVKHEHLLDYNYLFVRYDKQIIEDILNAFIDRRNWLIFLIDKNEFDKCGLEYQTEEVYNILYTVDDMLLPKPICGPVFQKNVSLNNGRLRYVFTNEFNTPKACFYILLKSQNDPIILNVIAELLNEKFKSKNELHKFSFYYECNYTTEGIYLYFYGFNASIIQLINIFIENMIDDSYDEKMFGIIKTALIKDLNVQIYNSPYKRIKEGFYTVYNTGYIRPEDMVAKLNSILYNDLKKYKKEFFIEMLACGNILFDDANKIFENICKKLRSDDTILPIIKEERKFVSPIIINTNDKINNACGVYFQVGDLRNYKQIAMAQVILNHASEKFYDTLRTKETFGYIVQSGDDSIFSTYFIKFIVQSEKSNEIINERINNFYYDLMENMNEDDFEISKSSVINMYEEEFKAMDLWGNFLWKMLKGDYWDLKYKENMKRSVEELRFEDVKENWTINKILRIFVQSNIINK
ncbi:Insulin-degrading enzyme [Astathelohania contejeani]|uniref:Insulin-degrading enzyme n=1 Tax=Astathelohania contejeani TaxID=164912 RepID=A0ABQ7I1G3_9MICR|nr:Insulin-degrading enzyme [Thelohania contejeani]